MAINTTDVHGTLNGRSVIYTDVEEIDQSNISEVLEAAMESFDSVQSDIEYLYQYYLGDQPILQRTKTYRDDIVNNVVVNRAYEIVSFLTGYLLSAPIQYIDADANDSEEDIESNDLVKLTNWCKMAEKDASDLEIAEWQSICGTAYRMALPSEEVDEGLASTGYEQSPFEIYTLDPRYTFVVYSSGLGRKPMMGVTFATLDDESRRFYCYTKNQMFVLDDDYNIVESAKPHILGRVPIVEYPANQSRLGDFEPVILLLDAINAADSDRLDALEEVVDNILCLEGMMIPQQNGSTQLQSEIDFMAVLKEVKGLMIPPGGKAYYLEGGINQTDTQTFADALYDTVLQIVGMPTRSARSTGWNRTSDTGSAAVLREGWSQTESRSRNRETMFKKSERTFLNNLVTIGDAFGLNIIPTDVDIRFPRRNYTNDSANVTNLVTMLSSDWIRPEFAYEHCNMTPDPHREYLLAKKWHEEQEQADINEVVTETEDEANAAEGLPTEEVTVNDNQTNFPV